MFLVHFYAHNICTVPARRAPYDMCDAQVTLIRADRAPYDTCDAQVMLIRADREGCQHSGLLLHNEQAS